MMKLDQQSNTTGPARAIFEIVIGASAQKAVREMTEAMVAHSFRALSARIALETGLALKTGANDV